MFNVFDLEFMIYPKIYGLPKGLGFNLGLRIYGLGFSVLLTALKYCKKITISNLKKKYNIN